jgi:hypothetical protein
VLEIMGKKKKVTNTVRRSKLEYLGHIMKNGTKYNLLKYIFPGKVLLEEEEHGSRT